MWYTLIGYTTYATKYIKWHNFCNILFCINWIAKWVDNMYYYGYFCVHYLASDNISVIRSRTLLWRKTRSISKHNTASFCVTMKRTRDLGDYDGSSGSSKRPMDSPKRVSCHARDYVGSPFPQFRKPQVIRCQYKMSCISQCRSINDQFININPR